MAIIMTICGISCVPGIVPSASCALSPLMLTRMHTLFPIGETEELRPKITQLENNRLEFELMQSVSRACIPDHLVIQNEVEVFIGIYFYQMILSPYLEKFRIQNSSVCISRLLNNAVLCASIEIPCVY